MATVPHLKVLFFDVFGTCVAQRPVVANELSNAAEATLQSESYFISDEVRTRVMEMSYEHWDELGKEWNKEGEKFVRSSIAEHGTVDWESVDKDRIALLPKLLAKRGLVILLEGSTSSELKISKGSLWNESQLEHLGRVWHRLTSWPDTCRGIELLNTKFSTVTLSNTYNGLIKGLVANGSIPFTNTFSSDLFESYKPNPKVYLGAAEKMGVKPEECALVAAHLSDLKGAKACGFYAIYVDRPLEEKSPELRDEGIPDLRVEQTENGFITLAQRLGIELD